MQGVSNKHCLLTFFIKFICLKFQDKAVRDPDEEISENTTKKLKASLKTFLGDSGFASGEFITAAPSKVRFLINLMPTSVVC